MTDTSNQPITFFDEAQKGSVKGMQKETGAKSNDLWMVPYKDLRIAPGFNVRTNEAKNEAKIAWLTEQMIQRGYDKTCPMAGYVVKEDGKNIVYVTAGHRRHAAVARAIAAGAEIEVVPIIIHPDGTNAEDLTAAIVTENNSDPLEPYDVAVICKRLQGYGHDNKAIAKRLGFTPEYVKNLFDLLAAPKAVRDMVTDGKVSATLAVQTVRKHGKDAAKVLKEGAAEAAAKGKTKVTGKHVKKVTGKAAVPAKKASKRVEHATTQQPQANTLDLIKRMADYIRLVRVGDDAADMLAEADSLLGGNADDSGKQASLPLEDPDGL